VYSCVGVGVDVAGGNTIDVAGCVVVIDNIVVATVVAVVFTVVSDSVCICVAAVCVVVVSLMNDVDDGSDGCITVVVGVDVAATVDVVGVDVRDVVAGFVDVDVDYVVYDVGVVDITTTA